MTRSFIEDTLIQAIKNRLPELDVTMKEIQKVNTAELRIQIRDPKKPDSPAVLIPADDIYSIGTMGLKQATEIADDIADTYLQAIRHASTVQGAFLGMGKEDALKHACFRVVNTKKNQGILKGSLHEEIKGTDLSIQYRLEIPGNCQAQQSTAATESLLGRFQVTEGEFKAAAKANQKALELTTGYVDKKGFHTGPIIPSGKWDTPVTITESPDATIFTATAGSTDSAYLVAFPEFLEFMARSLNANLYVIPSSVHELFFIPYDETKDRESQDILATSSLYEGNRQTIEPDEFLSDNAYFYDKDTKTLEMLEPYDPLTQKEGEYCHE